MDDLLSSLLEHQTLKVVFSLWILCDLKVTISYFLLKISLKQNEPEKKQLIYPHDVL